RRHASPLGGGVEATPRAVEALRPPDRHADRRGDGVLSSRGVPPEIPREESGAVSVLPLGLRPRPAPARAVGQRGRARRGATLARTQHGTRNTERAARQRGASYA